MSRTRLLAAAVGIGALLWGISGWARGYYSYPAMQVEVTGFDGAVPVSVTVTNPTANPAAVQAVSGVDGGAVTINGGVSVWATAPDGGTVPVAANVAGELKLDWAAQTASQEATTTCGTSTAVDLPASPLAARKALLVQNQGTVDIRIGLAPTNSTGYRLFAGESYLFPCPNTACALKCISGSASTTSTAYDIEIK